MCIRGSKEGSDHDVVEYTITVLLPLLVVIQKIRQDLGLDDALLLFSSHTKV
jgi:hypothetical protein